MGAGDGAAVPAVGISELEPGLSVVLLLRQHAIEPDRAWARVRDGRAPHAQSVAAGAQILAHDVEAEKGESRAVIDAGDGRGRSAVELADEEAFRIGRGEAGVVGEARVPAFGRRPVHGYRDFVRPHRADAQAVHGGRSDRWTHETDITPSQSFPPATKLSDRLSLRPLSSSPP